MRPSIPCGAVAVNNGGTLGGNGGVVGAVTVALGATVDPGSDANTNGTLTVYDNVTFSNGSTFNADLASASSGDKLVVSGAGKSISLPATWSVTVNEVGTIPSTGQWTIMQATGGATITMAAPAACPPRWQTEMPDNHTVILKRTAVGTMIELR